MDELASGIELDDSGIGDELRPPAAVEGSPEEHAAATSASADTPTAPRKTDPGRERPGEEDMSMGQGTSSGARTRLRAPSQTASMSSPKDAPATPLIATISDPSQAARRVPC